MQYDVIVTLTGLSNHPGCLVRHIFGRLLAFLVLTEARAHTLNMSGCIPFVSA